MLQAWRVAHPPVRGLNCIFSRPLVHVGFLKSWLAGGFNDKVVRRVVEIVKSCKAGQDKLRIYITGKLPLVTTTHRTGRGVQKPGVVNIYPSQSKHPNTALDNWMAQDQQPGLHAADVQFTAKTH